MTPYSDVYECFLSLITEHDFLQLTEEELETELEMKLGMAFCKITQFKDVEMNPHTGTFTRELTPFEKALLAQAMLVEWLNQRVYNIQNLHNQLSSKDFTVFSNANHLSELVNLHTYASKELNYLIGQYSLSNVSFKMK